MFEPITRSLWIVAAVAVTLTLYYIATDRPGAQALKPQDLPSRANFHLSLLIGQSNMAGFVPVERQDRVPDPRVLMLNNEDRWVPAVDPVHTDKSIAGVGLCRSFARTLTAKNPSITIGLIPCAVGGSSLEQWERGEDIYNRAVQRTIKAMDSGTLNGILWHHGETDAQRMGASQIYGDRLAEMIPHLRADLASPEVPLVVGQLGDYMVGNPKYLFAAAINLDVAQIPGRVDRTAFVDPQGLGHVGDHIHSSREAVEELGRRDALANERLQSIHTARAAESLQ